MGEFIRQRRIDIPAGVREHGFGGTGSRRVCRVVLGRVDIASEEGAHMGKGHVAKVFVVIKAPTSDVWDALVSPQAIKEYMFGANAVSDWQEGSPIVWRGEWQGHSYEDRGVILRLKPERTLQYTHFSPLAGLPDMPENYHTVTIELSVEGDQTRVVLTQDNNPTEQSRDHSAKNWKTMLVALKEYLEK